MILILFCFALANRYFRERIYLHVFHQWTEATALSTGPQCLCTGCEYLSHGSPKSYLWWLTEIIILPFDFYLSIFTGENRQSILNESWPPLQQSYGNNPFSCFHTCFLKHRWAPANVSQWDYYIFMILTSSPAFCSSLAFSFNLLADRSLLIVWLPDKTLILDTSQANETNMSFLSPVVPVWGDVQFSSGWIQSSCSPGPWLGRRSGEGKTAAEIPRPDYNVIREQGERNWQRHCNIYGAFTLTQIGCFQFIPMGAELLWDWRRIRESIALCNFMQTSSEKWQVGANSCQVQVVMCVMSVSKSVYCTGVSVEFSV